MQAIKNFKVCDQLSDGVSKLKRQRGEAEALLRLLQRKDKRSNKYFSSKKSSEPEVQSSENVCDPVQEDETNSLDPPDSFLCAMLPVCLSKQGAIMIFFCHRKNMLFK